MEDMKNKIEDDDWIQVESGQWHQVIDLLPRLKTRVCARTMYHCEDSCFLTMCQEVVDREDVIALLKGVLYPGIWSYECPTCSPRMEPVADLE